MYSRRRWSMMPETKIATPAARHQQRVERVEVDEPVDVEGRQARLVLVQRGPGRLEVSRSRRPGPDRSPPTARASPRGAPLGGPHQEEVGVVRPGRRVVGRAASRRGPSPAGSPGRRSEGPDDVEGPQPSGCFVPRASSTWTRSPVLHLEVVGGLRPARAARGGRTAARPARPRPSRPRRRRPRAPPPARSVAGSIAARFFRSWLYGPIRTEFSSLEGDGRHRGDAGHRAAADAKPGGCGRELSTLGVTRRSEPTVNLASAAFPAS